MQKLAAKSLTKTASKNHSHKHTVHTVPPGICRWISWLFWLTQFQAHACQGTMEIGSQKANLKWWCIQLNEWAIARAFMALTERLWLHFCFEYSGWLRMTRRHGQNDLYNVRHRGPVKKKNEQRDDGCQSHGYSWQIPWATQAVGE